MKSILVAISILMMTLPAWSKTWDVNDRQGLLDALEAAQAGDKIELGSANYGILWVANRVFSSNMTIAAKSGASAVFERIYLVDSERVVVRGVKVRPPVVANQYPAVDIRNGKANRLISSSVQFIDDSSNWSEADWQSYTSMAIKVNGGTHHELRRNKIKNTQHGIDLRAKHSKVIDNQIDLFSGDAIRLKTGNLVVDGNVIRDNVDLPSASWGNDGIQFLGEAGSTYSGLKIRRNRIIASTDSSRSFQGPLTGMGLYDGSFSGLIIENNLVRADSAMGIDVLNLNSATIRYNRVIDATAGGAMPAIRVRTNSGNGSGVTFTENIAPNFDLPFALGVRNFVAQTQ